MWTISNTSVGQEGQSAAGLYISVSMDGLGLRSVASPSRSPSSSELSGGAGGPGAPPPVTGRLHDVVWVMWLSRVRRKAQDEFSECHWSPNTTCALCNGSHSRGSFFSSRAGKRWFDHAVFHQTLSLQAGPDLQSADCSHVCTPSVSMTKAAALIQPELILPQISFHSLSVVNSLLQRHNFLL